VLAGLAHGQASRQPFGQQPRAPALGSAGRGELAEPGERGAGQVVLGLLAGGRQVGQPVLALGQAQHGGKQRVEPGE
jgi:hypothetical protein